ncbi:hypothetical protein GE115_10120 [Agromyces sp. CFH 90414]|uniref:Uncharacterized protein n=1 Tax=Agromyces agglutinans TaxID=2662258 RepID=A0A6I2FBZ9_9MICO|nr:hypothetical protein [Agromyces agglutinans]MRG60220.1 hypothetical protein [Agromyces agglutinans]
MATHLEYVIGPLGDLAVLPCACARVADHPRPGSAAVVPARTEAPAVRREAPHATRRRIRAVALHPLTTSRTARGRHAA